MSVVYTDSYPGIRQLVEERRAAPLHVRLAALGAPMPTNSEEKSLVEELRAKRMVSGDRAEQRVSPSGRTS